jgi:hypothetical protein
MVRVRPAALMRERSGWALGSRAEEELFRSAEVFSEGRASGDVFYGSTLVSIDLARALAGMDLAADPALLARVVDAIAGSVRVRIRAMRLAEEDLARRFPDRMVGTARTETRFRTEGTMLLVDVDLEASIGAASGTGGA